MLFWADARYCLLFTIHSLKAGVIVKTVNRIKYSIQKDAATTLMVYNSLGQLITTLVNGYLKAGEYEVSFNGENYPSGLYFYVLE